MNYNRSSGIEKYNRSLLLKKGIQYLTLNFVSVKVIQGQKVAHVQLVENSLKNQL